MDGERHYPDVFSHDKRPYQPTETMRLEQKYQKKVSRMLYANRGRAAP